MARTNIKPRAQAVISHGRQMGKSYVNSLMQNWYKSMQTGYQPKIKWTRKGLTLIASTDEFEPGLREVDIDPIQNWCVECKCGTRTSFDTFKFTSPKQITMFLIKWSE